MTRIADQTEAAPSTSLWSALPDPVSAANPFPMTPTQQALWIGRGQAVEYGDIGCYGYFEWERSELDVERYRTAWRRVVQQHPALRTVARSDGTQRVLTELPDVPITVTNLRGRADAATVLAELRDSLGHQSLEPTTWPLFDIRVTYLDNSVRLHLGVDLQLMDASCLFQIVFPDLVRVYENPDVVLPDAGLTFRDYVVWSSENLVRTGVYQTDSSWWDARIVDLPPAPDLPMQRGPREGPARFERCDRELGPREHERLNDTADQLGVTTTTVLIGLFAEVLRGWSEQRSFTLNIPVFDRLPVHPDIGAVAGDFTNALLVTAYDRGATFADRLLELQHETDEVRAHGTINGIDVLRRLAHERGSSVVGMPIVVTSLLEFQPARSISELGDEVYSISQTPQVSLDFQIRELDGQLRMIWDHLADVFAPGVIVEMFGKFTTTLDELLASDLADPDGAWQRPRFDLVPASDVAIRTQVNGTAAPVSDVLLHERLFAQEVKSPAAEAVVDAHRRLSYRELGSCARRIGRQLRADGVAVGELVAVVMDNGWEQYAAVYGILAAGGAYLPLDPKVPAGRLARLLAAANVRTVLTQTSVDERLSWPPGLRRHRVDSDFGAGDDGPLASVQTPDDLAYVIYTSGSTGDPKGVLVEHRGVGNLVDDVHRRFGVGPGDRLLAVSGLHFDASVYDVFGALAVGATVIIPRPFERAEPDHWAQLVRDEGVTMWNSVPVLAELVVGEAEARSDRPLASLRLAVLSGDWIPLTLPGRLEAQADNILVVGSGGPTETICWSLFYPISSVDPGWRSIPYGKPLSNQRYYILDSEQRERPTWAVGEIAVASPVGLARGYLGDAGRTAEKFVTLPETGERAYLTGDLGRYLPDGNIEIIGRDDFQVKIAGYRIELGEIEVALRRIPDVDAAIVVAPTSEHGVRRLLATVTPAAGTTLHPETLREALATSLPSYMVPTVITVVDELPLSRNGKIDRRALMAAPEPPELTTPDQPTGSLTGLNAVTAVVRSCVADVLGLPDVAAGDNFFRLGGDSLSGTRVAARLKELLSVGVPIRQVFDHPVLGQLGQALIDDPVTGPQAIRVAQLLVSLRVEDLDSS